MSGTNFYILEISCVKVPIYHSILVLFDDSVFVVCVDQLSFLVCDICVTFLKGVQHVWRQKYQIYQSKHGKKQFKFKEKLFVNVTFLIFLFSHLMFYHVSFKFNRIIFLKVVQILFRIVKSYFSFHFNVVQCRLMYVELRIFITMSSPKWF